MRVLVSAFGFSPYRGSECAVGWNIANELAKYHDVTVICGDIEKDQKSKIEICRYYSNPANPRNSNLHICFISPTKTMAAMEAASHIPGLYPLYYIGYRLWQKKAFRLARKLHIENSFDILHHLNMIGFREPGYLWKIKDVPFVWGPVGGGPDEPVAFLSIYSFSAKIKVLARNILNGLQKRFLLRPRLAARRAARIWAVTDADEYMIRHIWGYDCERMSESATRPLPVVTVKDWIGFEKLSIVWSGTHTYGKAMPILIRAVSELKKKGCTNLIVRVLGRGSETAAWRKEAQRFDVSECFDWVGFLPHEEAIKVMSQSHILVFTSLKEGTPHVVLEALTLGLPVICHDACGMGGVVTEKCGIKIPMVNPKTSIKGFSNAIERIVCNPSLVKSMSRAALERVKELTWQAKGKQISDSYCEIVEQVKKNYSL